MVVRVTVRRGDKYEGAYGGVEATRTVSEWADLVGMRVDTLQRRLERGWSIEKALGRPLVLGAEDLTGQRFGHWLVQGKVEGTTDPIFWDCQCGCGRHFRVSGDALRRGRSNSCRSCAGQRVAKRTGFGGFKDLTGERYGHWRVLGPADPDRDARGMALWRVECGLCGHRRVLRSNRLLHGSDVMACLRCLGDKARERFTTHGKSQSSEYKSWQAMRTRCSPKAKTGDYLRYYGRGIKVCDRWQDFQSFYEDMGPKPEPKRRYSIDRIDNDGDYEPCNCRWATAKQQMQNTCRTKRLVWRGRSLTCREWADEFGLKSRTLRDRLKKGWPMEKALTTPVRRKKVSDE